MTTANQHALKWVLQEGGIQAVITCLGHDECEALRKIEEEAATVLYGNRYSLFEEYYAGGTAPIQSNLIDLKDIELNDFVEWKFADSHPTVDEVKTKFSSDKDGHVLIPYIDYNDFVTPDITCVGPHAQIDEPCVGENFREYISETGEMWSGFTGAEGATLRSGPITIENSSDGEWHLTWDYA
jgi:hypothetical protein